MRSFTFKWPHDAEEVYVTGTFDNWTKSERLEKVGQVFQKTVTLPESSEKIYYKFVVDGRWTTDHAAPQEKDPQGNDNNVLLPDQMDKAEESSQAAAINNVVPESTTAHLAGAVPLEQDKKDKADDKQEETAETQEEDKAEEETTTGAAILSSAAPGSTTAQLAGAVPLEKKDEPSLPGALPETPATELDKEVKVDPLPAAEGAVNPIKLQPGEEVPKDISASAVDSHVTLDKESYEKSDRIPGLETTLPSVTGNMIPESSLPITGAGEAAVVNTVTPEATTSALAGEVPLEEARVPEIVKKSQEDANADPGASASSEGVREKAAVEHELLDKVAEAPSTSEGTAEKGTEKSETDKTAAEKVLGAATSAGEVALGAAVVAAGTASSAAAGAATKASDVATEAAAKASDAAAKAGEAVADIASKATAAASGAATSLPEAVKGVLPGAAQETLVGEQPAEGAAAENVSPEVPAEVKESLKEAGASPEAAVNTAAVQEKKEYEAELLEKVKPTEAAGESSAASAQEAKPAEEFPKPVEEPAPAEAPQAESKPETLEGEQAQAVEPPQPVEAVKTVDEAKPTEEVSAATSAQPAEPAKAAEEPKPAAEQSGAAEAPKPAETKPAVTNGSTTAAGTGDKAAVDGPAASERKKKNRISGFFNKLKHKFA